jgi:hypothetical protein
MKHFNEHFTTVFPSLCCVPVIKHVHLAVAGLKIEVLWTVRECCVISTLLTGVRARTAELKGVG